MTQIRYRDFIEPDDSVTNLIAQMRELSSVWESQLKKMEEAAVKMEAPTRKNTAATIEGQEAIRNSAAEVDRLYKEHEKLQTALENTSQDTVALREAVRQKNAIDKLEVQLAQSKEGSYNRLSAQYSLNKIKLNQMSQAERENTAAGKQLEQQTFKLYQEMIRLQEATGKHSLSVGNYSKGLYGLNTAVNQVTRELPTLGMNLNTFFLAISNNIPMLVDEIDRLRVANKLAVEEGKSSISVGKALVKSIFSWQTALSIGVALLVLYGKDMIDWIGKMIKGTKAIDEQAEAQKRLNEVRLTGAKDAQDDLVKLEVLYNASQDVNRSYEERVLAVKNLKREWPKYFDNLTNEDIIVGKAAKSYTQLSQAIMATAQARAAYDKIVANLKEVLDLQQKIKDAQERHAEIMANVTRIGQNVIIGNVLGLTSQERIVEESLQNINKLLAENDALAKGVVITDLFGGKDGDKKASDETLALLRKWTDTVISIRKDSYDKERTLLAIKYDREIEDLKIKLSEDEKLTVKGREAINGTIIALEQKKNAELLKLDNKHIQDLAEQSKKQIEALIKAVEEGYKISREQAEKRYKIEENAVNLQYDLRISEIDILKTTEAEKTKLRLQAEKERLQKILELNMTSGRQLSAIELEIIRNTIKKIDQEIAKVSSDMDIYSLFGLKLDDDQKNAVDDAFKFAKKNLENYADDLLKVAKAAVSLADDRVASAQKALDAEIEARNNGYAYNITYAQKNLELAKQSQEKALKQQRQAQEAQLAIDAISQASNMITASAKIWGTLGFPAALPALAIMWGSFIGAQVKAYQVVKETYGEGGMEILEGGSHASGNDIFLGHTASGKQRRAEGGEAMMIVNKGKTKKYRSLLPGIAEALNKGVFEEKYMQAYNTNGGFNFPGFGAIEKDVSAIRKQGERTVVVDGRGRTIVKYKNLTQKIYA